MKRYKLTFYVTVKREVVVSAESEEEAWDKVGEGTVPGERDLDENYAEDGDCTEL